MTSARDVLARHPRHLVLASLVAGLLAGRGVVAVVVAGSLAAVAARSGGRGLALGAVAAVLAGGAVADARLAALDRTTLGPRPAGAADLRAVALERARPRDDGGAALLARVVAGRGAGERLLVRTRLPVGREVDAGAEIRVLGRLAPLGPRGRHARVRGAHALVLADAVDATGRRRGGVAGRIDALRRAAERALAHGLPPREAALARGMVLGQDEALAPLDRDRFRAAGLAHLLAASGQNVALLCALALPLLAALGAGRRTRLVLALGLVAVYVPLAGAGPSIQRAGIMGAAGLVAALAGRPASRWYALGLAAAGTLVLNPRAPQDVGWQLSFAALVAILLLAAPCREALVRRRWPGPLADALALTLAATAGTAPLLAHHFGEVSLVSLPANLVAAALVAPVMWLGALAAAVGPLVPTAGDALLALAAPLLGALEAVATAAAAVPHAVVPVRLPLGAALALLGLIPAVAALRMVRPRALAWARAPAVGIGALAVVAALAWPRPALAPGLHLTVLDVGQGDAILLRDGPRALLLDTGRPDGPVLDRLREEGVRRLDALVLSHPAADHDGAAARVLSRVPVGVVLDGTGGRSAGGAAARRAAAARGVRVVAAEAGRVLRLSPRLRVEVLWPRPGDDPLPGEDPNDRAAVLAVTAGRHRMLLPADAESGVLGRLRLGPVDVMTVPHHGSADPGLPGVLRRVRPRLAVISAGRGNPYGHPTPETLGALADAGVPVRRTDRDGTVRILEGPGGELRVAVAGR